LSDLATAAILPLLSVGFSIFDFGFSVAESRLPSDRKSKIKNSVALSLRLRRTSFRRLPLCGAGDLHRRQQDHPPRALALAALQADRAAAGLDPPQRLGQAQPAPSAGGLVAEERAEGPLHRRLVHPAPVVAH